MLQVCATMYLRSLPGFRAMCLELGRSSQVPSFREGDANEHPSFVVVLCAGLCVGVCALCYTRYQVVHPLLGQVSAEKGTASL